MNTTTFFNHHHGKCERVLEILKKLFVQCQSVRVDLFPSPAEEGLGNSRVGIIVSNTALPGVLTNCLIALGVGEAEPLIKGFKCHIG